MIFLLRKLWIPIFLILASAAVARVKGQSFIAWWIYGTTLPIIALPHVLLILFGAMKPVGNLDEEIGFLTKFRGKIGWKFSCVVYELVVLLLLASAANWTVF